MRKFITNFLLILSCVALLLLCMLLSGIFIVGNQYEEDNYNASLIDKVNCLKSIDRPKIILVGNSNLAFGMDSGMLEDAMNMPVVNLGLHGGLGNAFHENIARLSINSGDIIIVCHSTYSDDNKIDDVELCWITLEYHKDLWDIMRPEDYYEMAKCFPKYWLKSIINCIIHDSTAKPPYSRIAFNKYGDVVVKPDKNLDESGLFHPGSVKLPQVNSTCTGRLNELNRYAKQRGATLLVAGYPIARGKNVPSEECYDKFQAELKRKLDCTVISDFRDYFMPYDCLYDYVLHLNRKGTLKRTQQLISDIKRWKLAAM